VKIVASLLTKNDLARYLEVCVDSLLEFVDEIRIVDDGSTDGTAEWLRDRAWAEPRVAALLENESLFFSHEGRRRQRLLEWTLEGSPSHILGIDSDEVAIGGQAIRDACAFNHDVFSLGIAEAWEASEDRICIRTDGGWRPHDIHALWRVPQPFDHKRWRIADRALACGRVPPQVDRGRGHWVDAEIIHWGWSCEAERVARHHRYVVADGGRFHRSTHLDSILNPCERVDLEGMDWPAGLLPYRDAILAKVTSTASPVSA
jgi:hypothetical protein